MSSSSRDRVGRHWPLARVYVHLFACQRWKGHSKRRHSLAPTNMMPALMLVELLIEPCVLPCCVPPVLDGPIQLHDFDRQTGSWQSKHKQRTPKPPNHMLYTTPIGHNDRMNNVKLQCYGKTQVNLTGFDLNYQRGVFRILHQRRAPSALKL